MQGEVGEAEKQGKTKQEVAKIHAATAVLETERKAEKAAADAKLTNKEIQIGQDLSIARINAKREAERRDAELNTDVEKKCALMELERLRATTVVQAKIEKESSQQKADAALYAQEKKAEGKKFDEQADAEAAAFRRLKDAEADYAAKEREAEANFLVTKRQAEAEYFKKERDAQAQLIAQQAEAQGMTAMAKAYGDMASVLGGPQGLVSFQHPVLDGIPANTSLQMQYIMITNGTYERLANANANAIKGLQPKINVWNTGAQGDDAADPTAPIRNLFQSLPPLLSTIHDQTGIQPPNWLAQMPNGGENYDPKKMGLKLRNGSETESA
jgi:flotillin